MSEGPKPSPDDLSPLSGPYPVTPPPARLPSGVFRRARVKSLSALPSMLTVGNGICGFAAVVDLAKAYAYIQEPLHAKLTHADAMLRAGDHMLHAVIFLGIAMLFDMLDGKVARMTGTAGRFGAELDSLCDAVSFGLAPAFLLRVFGEAVFGTGISEPPDIAVRLLWGASAVYLGCAVLRLARFNVETTEDDDHRTFRGLPSPAAAGAVVSLFLISHHYRDSASGDFGFKAEMAVLIPLLGAVFGLLMVSRFKYIHLFNRLVAGGKSMVFLVGLLLVGVAAWVLLGPENLGPLLALVYIGYVLSGPIGFFVTLFRKRGRRSRRAGASARMKPVR